MRQTELHFGDEDRELIESCRAWFAPRTGNQSGTRLVSLGSEAHLKPRSCRFPASDEPSSGEYEWRIWKMVRNTHCTIFPVPANLDDR